MTWHGGGRARLLIQRAADAWALAVVAHLPDDLSGAYSAAYDAATRNGYINGVSNVTVTPTQDAASQRRLDVQITAPVHTFFPELIGMETIDMSRRA